MIIRQIQVGGMAVFAYIVGDRASGEALAIDPAANVAEILKEAERDGLAIRYIVNTHAHPDHTGGNAEMKERTGAAIVIHEADAQMLTSIPSAYLRMFGARPSPPADLTVRDGSELKVGETTLTVIHTPGHTPGGMCLHADGAVFTGDTLFVGGVGRTDLPGGSWDVMAASIREKLFSLPDSTVVYPGHNYGSSPASTIGHEKSNNPYI
ncbi:MAG: putative metallo-hydrolase [Syntrophaceae bacterium PtaU1.Bin231]|nr:MAG: putative metallo-hydrolase [Syntrophaceae bacterium PtaU1.Bin231]HOG17165.1 MBL fold metallo-hydrolase [Syntrophales bacterium]